MLLYAVQNENILNFLIEIDGIVKRHKAPVARQRASKRACERDSSKSILTKRTRPDKRGAILRLQFVTLFCLHQF